MVNELYGNRRAGIYIPARLFQNIIPCLLAKV